MRGEWESGLSVAVPQHAASESPDRRAFVTKAGSQVDGDVGVESGKVADDRSQRHKCSFPAGLVVSE